MGLCLLWSTPVWSVFECKQKDRFRGKVGSLSRQALMKRETRTCVGMCESGTWGIVGLLKKPLRGKSAASIPSNHSPAKLNVQSGQSKEVGYETQGIDPTMLRIENPKPAAFPWTFGQNSDLLT